MKRKDNIFTKFKRGLALLIISTIIVGTIPLSAYAENEGENEVYVEQQAEAPQPEESQPAEVSQPVEASQPVVESAQPVEASQPMVEIQQIVEVQQPVDVPQVVETPQAVEASQPIVEALEETQPVESVQPVEVPQPVIEGNVPVQDAIPEYEVVQPVQESVVEVPQPGVEVALPTVDPVVEVAQPVVEQPVEEVVQPEATSEPDTLEGSKTSEEVKGNEETVNEETGNVEPESENEETENNESESENKGTGNSESESGTAALYNKDDIVINGTISKSSSVSDGTTNYFSFKFSIVADSNTSYSVRVYGNGVDEDICKQLAAAYLNGLVGDKNNIKVVDQDLTDAEKHSVNHDYDEQLDSELCWAYSAANILYQTNWITKTNAGIFNYAGSAAAYFETADNIASYLAYCLNNIGGDESNIWKWLFTGAKPGESHLKFSEDSDDALLSEYYYEGVYAKNGILKESDMKTVLDSLVANGSTGSTLGIYYKGGGGHAMTLTGFIEDSSGTPVAVIVADSDNSVRDETQSDDPTEKDNSYSVYPMTWGTTDLSDLQEWYMTPNLGYNAYIRDISTLTDSTGKEKTTTSIVPTVTRAISEYFDNSATRYFNDDYSLDVILNYDFLSFYDISRICYELIDDVGNVIYQSAISRTKSDWKELYNNNSSSFQLYFDEALQTLDDGNYKVQAYIDKDSFLGNYGWFAQRYNDGEGYFDLLVDTWVTLFRSSSYEYKPEDSKIGDIGYPEETEISRSQNKTGIDQGQNNSTNALMEAFLDEIVKQINIDYSGIASGKLDNIKIESDGNEAETGVALAPINNEEVKSNVRVIVNDILKAAAADTATVDMFKSLGVDIAKVDVSKLNLVMSTSIRVTKSGKYNFKSKDFKFKSNDKVFAMIKLADGTTKYIRVTASRNGRIEFELPENVVTITVVSL